MTLKKVGFSFVNRNVSAVSLHQKSGVLFCVLLGGKFAEVEKMLYLCGAIETVSLCRETKDSFLCISFAHRLHRESASARKSLSELSFFSRLPADLWSISRHITLLLTLKTKP